MHTPKWITAASAEFFYKQGLGFWKLGRRQEAIASFNKALALRPLFPEANAHRALVLRLMGRYDEAFADVDKAIALKPDYPMAYYSRGVLMVDKGEIQEAQRMFDKGLALKPDFSQILYALPIITKYQNVHHPHTELFKSLLNNSATPPSGKSSLHFALGKIHDDSGLYDEAFLHYQQGNNLCKKGLRFGNSYNPKETTSYSNRIIKTFTKEALSHPLSDSSSSPIFIVGVGRSGTTLTEQILSNHPTIASVGENSIIMQFITRLPKFLKRRVSYPEASRYLTPVLARHLAGEYERYLRSGRNIGPDIPFILNKVTTNFQHLGFIAMLFPKARIIHCMRNPLDIAISNYFQHFGYVANYSADLRDMGHFYSEYAKLMAHWRKVLPIPMLDVRYEDTIANTEQTVRRMLDFLGLEWDERCLAPHTNPTPVFTASNWQVRQPIYSHSKGRWRNYDKHLQPLKEILAALPDDVRLYKDLLEDQAFAPTPSAAFADRETVTVL